MLRLVLWGFFLFATSARSYEFRFLGCEAPESCPPQHGVAVVPQDGGTRAVFCNAAMIGPSAVITDEHCVRDLGFRPDSECDGKIFLYFPKPGTRGQSKREVKCHKILSKSDVGDESAQGDYAILSVSETLSEALRADPSPLKDDEKLRIKKFTFTPGEMSATYSEDICTALLGSLIQPDVTSGYDPRSLMGDCRAVHGNSGAALVDSHGNFRGVLLGENVRSGFEDYLRANYPGIAPTVKQRPLLLSPASCMRYFYEGRGMPGDCILKESERQARASQNFNEAVSKILQKTQVLDNWLRPRATPPVADQGVKR